MNKDTSGFSAKDPAGKSRTDRDFDNYHSGITTYITDKDVFFAKERLKLHESTPEEGVSVDVLKKYILRKYGI